MVEDAGSMQHRLRKPAFKVWNWLKGEVTCAIDVRDREQDCPTLLEHR